MKRLISPFDVPYAPASVARTSMSILIGVRTKKDPEVEQLTVYCSAGTLEDGRPNILHILSRCGAFRWLLIATIIVLRDGK